MGYDYDEMDVMKRHGDRPWRRKGIVKSMERVWDDRKRHDYDAMNINPQRYYEDMEPKGYPGMERQRPDPDYNKRHYDDIDKLQKALTAPKSIEMDHPANLGPSMPPNMSPNMYGFCFNFFFMNTMFHNHYLSHVIYSRHHHDIVFRYCATPVI